MPQVEEGSRGAGAASTRCVITRERLQDTLDDAVRRGRMTRDDATDLLAEILRRAISAPADRVIREVKKVDRRGRGRVPDRRLRRAHRGPDRLPASATSTPPTCAACATTSAATRTARRSSPRSSSDLDSVTRADGLGERVELREVLGVRCSCGRRGVLLQARAALGARDRDDVLALREQPGERDLRGRRVAPLRDRLDRARRAPGWRPSPRAGSAGCSCGSRPAGTVCGVSSPVRKPRPSGANGQERGVVLRAPRHDVGERVARPQRALGLHGGDRVDRVRALELLDAHLGQAERADLARPRPARPSRPRSPRAGPPGRRGAAGRGR